MGIPAFFRWLVDKYGNVITPTKEPRDSDGSRLKCDFSELNVNGEFDNLYLDMNGIIHPCAHPEKGPKPRNTQDMMDSIVEYLDLLFAIIRPRKLIYMAIDGVAPRAKMNQQRARRFRAALDSRITKEQAARDLIERLNNGSLSQEDYDAIQKDGAEKYHFDSNCITPGTEFMALVALTLRQYVAEKISTDPAWKDVKVIISDASVPGEGEHKIMEYIRHQRSQPDYNPNLKHVMYGLDADLIMLALSTHEVNFDILREFIAPPKGNRFGTPAPTPSKDVDEDEVKDFLVKDYQLLNLAILREYLDTELKCNPPFEYNVERIIDDFIFICFFVGNDFLPHLPSLQINEGAIDRLMRIYKELLPTFEGYLTDNGEIDLDRLRKVFVRLSREEEDILLRRKKKEERFAQGRNNRFQQTARTDITGTASSQQLNTQVSERHKQAAASILSDIFQPVAADTEENNPKKKVKTDHLSNKDAAQQLRENLAKATSKGTKDQLDATNREAAALLQQKMSKYNEKKRVVKVIDIQQTPEAAETKDDNTKKRKKKETEDKSAAEDQDDSLEKKLFIHKMKDVNIGSEGWRTRYYEHHFETEQPQNELVRAICQSYVDGLAWVLRYYFHGCCSWGWYYPYHYAPFILDLAENGSMIVEPQFELGAPFRPFQQLMSVLPKASGQFVPKPYRTMMGISIDGEDRNDVILHFYPNEFLIDVAPGQPTWKGVCQLPFIDENELLSALKPLDNSLTEDEAFRNSHGTDLIISHNSTSIGSTTDLPRNLEKPDQILGTISPVIPGVEKRLPPLLSAKVFTYKNPELVNESTCGILPGAILQKVNLEQYRTRGIQNSSANRMINHELGSNQYKNRNQQNGGNFNSNFNNNNFNNNNNTSNQNYNNNGNNRNYNNNQNNYNNNNQNYNNQNNNQNYNNQNYNNNNQNYNNNNWNQNQNNMGGNNWNQNQNYNNNNYNNNQNYNNNMGGNNWNNQNNNMNNWNNNNNNMGYNNNNMGGYINNNNNYNNNNQQQQQGIVNMSVEQKQTVLNNMMLMMKQYNEGANNMTPQEYNQMSTMMNMLLQQQQQDLQLVQNQNQFNVGRQNNNNDNHHNKKFNNNNNNQGGYNNQGGNKNYNSNQGGNKNYNNNNNNNNYNNNNNQQQQGGNKMKYNPFAKSKK
ncbi:5'-3' exoribonuclease [Cavenderia fasciculata]|uniref:5'-3' exoribonuclease n=1 Tax=Cavenderia fasciculata TaxID=261658 RepID=F4QEC0_CACFS|nr:5'-3' exoribonuclease [Cavenderia fasciculata]EGG14067.1 5'-3' exoribonuclease [Cavenderia fasciculata]|eukprot:XP_004350775.1 5'-3' exoribonuclease [Cavenderia fasciculata]